MIKALLSVTLFFSLINFAHADDEDLNTDCAGSTRFLQTSGLACVHCGIQKSTGLNASDKWLALIGSLVTKNNPDANYAKGGASREAFHRKTIEAVQAFGFCLANKLDNSGRVTAETGFGSLNKNNKNVRSTFFKKNSIDESDVLLPLISGSMTSPRDQGEVSARWAITKDIYGFKRQQDMDALIPRDIDDLYPSERRERLFNLLDKASAVSYNENASNDILDLSTAEGRAMNECLKQISSLQKNFSHFSIDGKYKKDNTAMCDSMAKSCGLNSRFCDGPMNRRTTLAPPPPGPAPGAGSGPSLFNKGSQ